MIIQMGAQNPAMQQQMLGQIMGQDQRILEVIMAMQGLDMNTMNPEDMGGAGGGGSAAPPRPAPKQEPKKEAPPPDLRTPEQKEADEFKQKGNELYKKKEFKEALEMYDKAIEKEPNDVTYVNNKCAVLVEMGADQWDKALDTLKDVLTRRYEINTANSGGASFEKIAKIFNRVASIYEKKKEFDTAIEYYNKALCEDNNKQTRNALRDLQRKKEKSEKDAYMDPVKAEEHREKGNELFKEKKYIEAKAQYDEAVMRNPTEPKLYSNRAAALTKLMAYPDALRDLDECLKLDPKFIKAYSRKGAAHFFMKEYNKALQSYENGLKIDANSEECKLGREQVIAKISESSRSSEVDEEQIRHAMADPEIQNILHDPQIKMFLQNMQENPAEGQKAMMADPKLQEAVTKLMAAGIIKTG